MVSDHTLSLGHEQSELHRVGTRELIRGTFVLAECYYLIDKLCLPIRSDSGGSAVDEELSVGYERVVYSGFPFLYCRLCGWNRNNQASTMVCVSRCGRFAFSIAIGY